MPARQMSVQPDTDGCDDIRPEQIVLPRRVGVNKITVDINSRHYSVYFNMDCHLQDCANTTYVFIHMADQYKAINLCPEDTLPDLTSILQMEDRHLEDMDQRMTVWWDKARISGKTYRCTAQLAQ